MIVKRNSENFSFRFGEKKWLPIAEKREKNLYRDCTILLSALTICSIPVTIAIINFVVLK